MSVVALAGGVGAGKFLRGLVRATPPKEVTVVVNTGDDAVLHGLHVSPDLDSVAYWLAGEADTERGWGRRGDTFRATEELRRFGAPDAWFNLGDLDMAVHLFRSHVLAAGGTLSEATARIAEKLGVTTRLIPMTDDAVITRVDAVDRDGGLLDLHFQEYWVRRGARDSVKAIRYEGAAEARPAPGVLQALAAAETIVVCPSNPVASIAPILAVSGIREAVAGRRDRVVGVSPIVGGAPLRGMADRLMPTVGAEVSAVGAARCYEGLLGAWVLDERDRRLAPDVERLGLEVVVTDTIMRDDETAEALARAVLGAAAR